MSKLIRGRGRRAILLGFLPFATALAQSKNQPAPDKWENVRVVARKLIAEQGLPSISIAVAKDGKIIWEESFGWADREKMIAATPNTMYSLASISKPITATGMMTLVEQGKVDLDKPANDYLGTGKLTGLAGDANAATVRKVMSHTSGLPLHYQFYYVTNNYPPVSNDETIARYAILVNPPGEVYQYSNLGYGIIDHIISRVSGIDYTDYMRREVFIPLGLTHTSIGIAPGLEQYAAQRYDSKQRPIPFYDFDHRGASAVYASAHDLVRFGMFHLKDHLSDQKPILKDATLDMMKEPIPPATYGLGWSTNDDRGIVRRAHGGGMPGVATTLNLYPTENLAVVVLTNSSRNVSPVAVEIAKTMIPKYPAEAPPRPPNDSRYTPNADLAGEWTGTLRAWDRTIPLTLVFQPDGDVHAKLEGQLETLVNDPSWKDNNFTGRFAGNIPTPDAGRWPHSVLLDLRLRNGMLSGSASAQTTTEPMYYALTSYVSLTRKVAAR